MITFNILILIWWLICLVAADRARKKAGHESCGLYSNQVQAELSFTNYVGMHLPLFFFLAEAIVFILILMP